MIKLHVERFIEACGETFQRRIAAACVRVADDAHRNLRRCELAAMTVGARFVTGKARRGRVVRTFVTRVAGDGGVFLARVKELGVVVA